MGRRIRLAKLSPNPPDGASAAYGRDSYRSDLGHLALPHQPAGIQLPRQPYSGLIYLPGFYGTSFYNLRLAPHKNWQYLVGVSCLRRHKRHWRGIDNAFIHGRTELGLCRLSRHTKLDPPWRCLRLDNLNRTTRSGEKTNQMKKPQNPKSKGTIGKDQNAIRYTRC